MKQAVAWLNPYIEAEKVVGQSKGKILMATVKGDVHDIGKNIVGVVLGCNGYDIVDMGVMVPCEKILETAIREKVDIIGLSGLITPSLDEMVYVAREMQRQGFKIPLMIGGATTSKAHTAVKIDPQYHNDGVVYVADASRAVGVATTLLSPEMKPAFLAERRAEYEEVRVRHANRQPKAAKLSYAQSIAEKFQKDWDAYTPPRPQRLGLTVLKDYPLEEIRQYIDWTPFFITWSLAGKFPAILKDEVVGAEATRLYNDAQAMLDKLIGEKLLQANAVIGFWPAAQVNDDDVVVYADESRQTVLTTLHHLRQQSDKVSGKPNYSLADFVAPESSNAKDYIGGFAVTAGLGAETLAKQYRDAGDDYNAILVQALADRLAEAFAERLHERVRKEFWGYQPAEALSNEELIKEKYVGIRPAPGYPACPEHTEKGTLFQLLEAEQHTGIALTEHFAMWPAASVSGFYYSLPESTYFNVGKIDRDQVASYAQRKGWDMAKAEKWLGPNLGYDPQ